MADNTKNSEYWGKRALEREENYQLGSKKTIAQVKRSYDLAFESINKELMSIESQLDKRGGVLAEDFNAYQARMVRLAEIKARVDHKCKELANIELKTTSNKYKDLVKDGYFRTLFDIQKGVGFGFDFGKLPDKDIDLALKSKWKGRNFSKSVWNNTTKLANRSKDIITAGFMSGISGQLMVNQLKQEMGVGQFVAERLIRSETNFYANQGEMLAYKESGIKEYEYLAALDNRTSELCQEQDGKVYKVSSGQTP